MRNVIIKKLAKKSRRQQKAIQLESGQEVAHDGQIDLVCIEGYQHGSGATNSVQLKCSYGSWDAFASSVSCVPRWVHNGQDF